MVPELGPKLGRELGRELGLELGRELGLELGRELGLELGPKLAAELHSLPPTLAHTLTFLGPCRSPGPSLDPSSGPQLYCQGQEPVRFRREIWLLVSRSLLLVI